MSSQFKINGGKFIFIHIPKTGGISVKKSFGKGLSLHLPIKYYKYWGRNKDTYSFAFSRNPWDRLVSSFFYINQGGYKGIHPVDLYMKYRYLRKFKNSFSLFVKEGLKIYPEKYTNKLLFKPQIYWVMIEKEIAVSFMGKFESIGSDLQEIYKLIGIEYIPIQKMNHSSHKKYQELYDDEMVDIVGDVYREDIETFGYTFS